MADVHHALAASRWAGITIVNALIMSIGMSRLDNFYSLAYLYDLWHCRLKHVNINLLNIMVVQWSIKHAILSSGFTVNECDISVFKLRKQMTSLLLCAS